MVPDEELPPQRSGFSDRERIAVARDLTERSRREPEDHSVFNDLLGIGLMLGGAALAGKQLLKHDLFQRTLNSLGKNIRDKAAPFGQFFRTLGDEIAGTSGRGIKYMQFELLERVSAAQAVTSNAASNAFVQEVIRNTRRGLIDEGFEKLDRSGLTSLRTATVADLLEDNAIGVALRNRVGDNAFQAIKKASDTGMITSNMSLTKGHAGLFVDMFGSGGSVIDTRFMKPARIMRALGSPLSQLKVPFTNFRPFDAVANLFRPLGQGEFAGYVGNNLQLDATTRTYGGLNAVVGGRLVRQTGADAFETLETNFRLGKIGRVGQGRLERYGHYDSAAREALERRINTTGGSVLDVIQQTTGVGPAYKTRESYLSTLFLNPLRRRDAVRAGRAQLKHKQNVSRYDDLGFLAKQYGGARHEAEAERAGQTLSQYYSTPVTNTPAPTSVDKVKAYMGMRGRSVVTEQVPSAHSGPLIEVPYTFSSHTNTKLFGTRPTGPMDAKYAVNEIGEIVEPTRQYVQHYAYAGTKGGIKGWLKGQADTVIDIGHAITNRMNDLIGATVGVGFRPTVGHGILGGAGALAMNYVKLRYGIIGGFHAGLEYLDYADHLFESTIGRLLPTDYDSPKKMLIGGYQALRLGQTKIRELLGVQQGSRYLEDLMPGSIDSGASFLARTAAPIIAGGAKWGTGGAIAGAAVSALIGGTGVDKSYDTVLGEFTGDVEVPVRKSRWWVLGRQPFEGGQIDRFVPHWTRRALSDYKFTDVQYGSKDEYYANVSRLPTFHNLFGLTSLFQEGGFLEGGDRYLANKHVKDRPYPDTPGVQASPIAGLEQFLSTRGPFDAPIGAGQRLGYGTAGSMPEYPADPQSIGGRIAEAADSISEIAGLYKFMLVDLPFGDGAEPAKMATYSTIGSQARAFYDEEVGGMLGLTEAYRRFVLTKDAKQGINTIPNTMPSWLPGALSEFQSDRSYYLDFTLGDPYAKVQQGEMRLPGAGYEALHRLHSETPGVYDPVDRFMILADVAPHSEAYKHYRDIVQGWADAGVIDESWRGRFDMKKEQVSAKMERYKFHHRRFTGMITDPDPEGTAKRFNSFEKMVASGWEIFTHDVVPKVGHTVPIFGGILSNKLLPIRSPIEHYREFQVEGEEFADWRSPWKQLVRPHLSHLIGEDPITATIGGAALGLAGATPFGAFGLSVVGGGYLGGSSLVRSVATGRFRGGYTPGHRENQYELADWFDKFAYTKSRVLEERAIALEDAEMAAFYRKAANRTISGLDYKQKDVNSFMLQAMRAVDRSHKSYMTAFRDMPLAAQSEMVSMMPEHLQPVFAKMSHNQSLFSQYRRMAQTSADARAASYFAEVGMPSANWGGWHPDVPMDAIKIKMIDSGVNSVSADIHKFDLYREHRRRASPFDRLGIPRVGNLHVSPLELGNGDMASQLQSAGFSNVRFRYGPGEPGITSWSLLHNPLTALNTYIRDQIR